jgi:hypothetical protein
MVINLLPATIDVRGAIDRTRQQIVYEARLVPTSVLLEE